MELKINGKVEQMMEVATIRDLLEVKGLDGRPVVIEHNGEIIKSESWGQTRLNDGDVVEILRLVGGG